MKNKVGAPKGRVSPMKGRKISEEDRGPNAPKLGRPFAEGRETERIAVCMHLPVGTLANLLRKTKAKSKAEAVKIAIRALLKQ